jgi:hypothetical protein
MLFSAKAADQIVRYTGTKRRRNTKQEINKRNSWVKLLNDQHTCKGNRVKEPLRHLNFFAQDEYGNDSRKNRRQILDRHRRGKRHLLQCQEEEK